MNEKNLVDVFWGWLLGIGLLAGLLLLFRALALWYWRVTDIVTRLDRIASALERLSPPAASAQEKAAPSFSSREEYETWKKSSKPGA